MSLGISLLRAIAVSIVKRYSFSRSNEEVVTKMEYNRGESGHVKKKDVDEAIQLQVGERNCSHY